MEGAAPATSADTEYDSETQPDDIPLFVPGQPHVPSFFSKTVKRSKPGMPPKEKPFRMAASQFFLTFPQNTLDKALALSRIVDKWDESLIFALVAHEKHKDEGDHLHIVFKLNGPINIKDPAFFDFIGDSHGNYQACKALKKAITYAMKDNDYVIHGTLPMYGGDKPKTFDQIATEIMGGATPTDIKNKFPGAYLQHRLKIQTFYQECRLQALAEDKKHFPGFKIPDPLNDYCGNLIAKWVNDNCGQNRSHKQRQLYLWGPPGGGKTFLTMILEAYFNILTPAADSTFVDGYSDEFTQLVVFDEFKGQKCLTWMNKFLEGSTMSVNIKGGFAVKTSRYGNKPVIICSNFSPEDAYKNCTDTAIAPFKERILEVCLPEGYRINLELNE